MEPWTPDPAVALLAGICLVGLVLSLFWPYGGLWGRWSRLIRLSDRALIEDALKSLFDQNYRQSPSTMESLAEALNLSEGKSEEVLTHLRRTRLVAVEDDRYRLTPAGRDYALRIIRVHRLLESSLAEGTQFGAADWHLEADRREHLVTPDEVEALSARMGHPAFDPHGDPIPTIDGLIPEARGQSLEELPIGATGEILHIEDEPQTIYEDLVARNLHPGTLLQLLEIEPESLRILVEGQEHLLDRAFARNLTVLPRQATQAGVPRERLSNLKSGESAAVSGISPACRGLERRRLLDLGIIPGTVIKAELSSPSGDPVGYRVRGALIALRNSQADLIEIEPLERRAAS